MQWELEELKSNIQNHRELLKKSSCKVKRETVQFQMRFRAVIQSFT